MKPVLFAWPLAQVDGCHQKPESEKMESPNNVDETDIFSAKDDENDSNKIKEDGNHHKNEDKSDVKWIKLTSGKEFSRLLYTNPVCFLTVPYIVVNSDIKDNNNYDTKLPLNVTKSSNESESSFLKRTKMEMNTHTAPTPSSWHHHRGGN
eukprot:9370906-Ditylum_brightwellii.AAC.1